MKRLLTVAVATVLATGGILMAAQRPPVSLAPGDTITITGSDLGVTAFGSPVTSVVITAASAAPTPSPTPAPTLPPTPAPTPTPTAVPAPSNILGVNIAALPTSGAAWDRMLASSKTAGPVTITYSNDSTGGKNEGALLALAFVSARLNDQAGKDKVVSIARTALAPTTSSARSLEVGRNLAPIAIALDFIGEHSLDADLLRWRNFNAADQGPMAACQGKRPNNWGTVCGLARMAVDAHLGDIADLALAAKIHRGWLGDRTVYSAFSYGDLSWQCDTTKPVGINPAGCVKAGVNIDGVLPDDQRRASSFPSYVNENYVWQAMGEASASELILVANGYPDAFTWSASATTRAYQNRAAHSYGVSGDDGWQAAMARKLGVTISTSSFAPGKSFGWVDWLYGV